MPLDIDAATRQAFGYPVRPDALRSVLDGRITLSPHPTWTTPGIPDWAADPFDDRNWRHQFQMLRWLDPVRNAACRGDEEAFRHWFAIAHDWTVKNPLSRPRSKWAWRDMVDGIRALHFALAAPAVSRFRPDALAWLEDTLGTHVDWLADPAHLGHSNHALNQHIGLFVAARVLNDRQNVELAVSRLDELLTEQYDDEGINAEGAIAYHYRNYRWWTRTLERLDLEGIDRPSQAGRLEASPTALAHATRPDGMLVPIGDTDAEPALGIKHPHLDYVRSAGAQGMPPSEVTAVYSRGYAFGRSGWGETEREFCDETFYSLSFGESTRVHGHADGGSLTFSSHGVNWVVDPGKYQYGDSPMRDHVLSRRAHSLVDLPGRTPAPNSTVTLVRSVTDARYHEYLLDDNSFAPIRLSRRVIYSVTGDYLVVVDSIAGDETVDAELRWQLGHEVRLPEQPGTHQVPLDADGAHALLAFSGTKGAIECMRGSVDPLDGWVSSGWKQKEPATTIIQRKSGTSFRFISVLAASTKGRPTVAALRGAPAGVARLEIDTRTVCEIIELSNEQVAFPESDELTGPPKADRIELDPGRASAAAPAPETRAKVFASIEAARDAARGAAADMRRQLAVSLRDEAHRLGLGPSRDCGVTAALSDLTGAMRGKDNPRRIDAHRTALINWEGDSSWRPTFYPLPVVSHDGLPASLPSTPALHTIPVGPLVLPFGLDPAPRGKVLSVLFHGAIDRAKTRVPILQRWRHHRELELGPTMCIADPTLDLDSDLRLGWYLGTEVVDLHACIADLVQHVADRLGCETILLTGSSGGGFAALQTAVCVGERAVAVPMSPQVDLRNYPQRFNRAAYSAAFGLQSEPQERKFIRRISVVDRIVSRGQFPRVHLISNVGDVMHRELHEQLLRDKYGASGHGTLLRTVSIDLGAGHRTVGNEEYTSILTAVFDEV
ncbi:heparinase II/III domain-containing protein [Brachybacterium timonense]|uniref:heparinase II/III domain-containing protein n=1 Tax=Brachybacterium timonense TaxID=2050896 RepID=UPI000D0B1CBC|nr:heparinase II/III family protein [Brachybacterium timonense]